MAQPRKVVTSLRPAGPGRVAVELDGAPWRRVPTEAAVRAGLAAGVPLDRTRARTLGRELRRLRAIGTAVGALRTRDRSAAELASRLEARGIAPVEREHALDTLVRAGLVDDERFARSRALTLAERGNGDALIRDDLERRNVPAATIDAAVAGLAPESERAARVVERRGASAKTARYLAARGFDEDSIGSAVAWEDDETVG